MREYESNFGGFYQKVSVRTRRTGKITQNINSSLLEFIPHTDAGQEQALKG